MSQPYPYPPTPDQHSHIAPYANGTGNGYTRAYQEQSPRLASYGPPDEHAQAHVGATQPSPAKEHTPRTNRLRKACDSCSIRKVKCDEAGPPCRACAALDIPCTYERPSRRRGPPNKHAEAIKRQRLEETHRQSSPYVSTPTTPAPVYPLATAPSSAIPAILCADSICPIELVQLLIDDFFTYVHPLCPFPHEPSFREAFRQRKDISDRSFLALLASMIGALIAQFPRRPRKHLKAMGKSMLFPQSIDFVEHCEKMVVEARGPGYLEARDINVYDAATSYFVVCMNSFTYRWALCNLYLGECLTIIRTLGFCNSRPAYPPMELGNTAIMDGHTTNFIEEEIGRRIFWTIFVSIRSAKTMMISMGDVPIRTPTPTQGYPPLPAEVDDQYIHATHIERQPHGIISMLTGFNANVRVYRTIDSLVALENSYAVDHVYDLEKYKRVLRDSMQRVKQVTDNAPGELSVWPVAGSRSPSLAYSIKEESEAGTLHPLNMQEPTPTATAAYAEKRRHIGYEIQKANIYASCLSCRSFYLERYWALFESTPAKDQQGSQQQAGLSSPTSFAYRSPPANSPTSALPSVSGAAHTQPSPALSTSSASSTTAELRAERESIANELLIVLSHIRPVHMEPNSVSFCMKIRGVAGTLLPDVAGNGDSIGSGATSARPGTAGSTVATPGGGDDSAVAASYLRSFLEILMELEKSGGAGAHRDAWGGGGAGQEGVQLGSGEDADVEDEEEENELRRWAGLREQQKEFATRGAGMFT